MTGHFLPVIDDSETDEKEPVTRVIFCSGKVYYDLARARKSKSVRIVRLEQFYPFPHELLQHCIARYKQARDWVWLQEEPQNMGGWSFIERRLSEFLPAGQSLRYLGRQASGSTATGFSTIHQMEQQQLVADALA